jgi:hypothetical protein
MQGPTDASEPHPDQGGGPEHRLPRPHYERNESDIQRIDRNYGEQLQELRVTEIGVQILFAALLSLTFQARFGQTSGLQKGLFVAALMLSALSMAQLIAPVAVHRFVFHQRKKDELVRITNVLAISGLWTLILAVLFAAFLVLDFILPTALAAVVVFVLAVIFVGHWVALPLWIRRHHG